MKARRVFEFVNPRDKRRGLNKKIKVGYGKKPSTKSWAILKFIEDAGEEGRSLTEIQKFIYFVINGAPYGEDWFYEKTPSRRSRGYWATALYGGAKYDSEENKMIYDKGLLGKYCRKNEKGKWVLDRYPKPGKNIYY